MSLFKQGIQLFLKIGGNVQVNWKSKCVGKEEDEKEEEGKDRKTEREGKTGLSSLPETSLYLEVLSWFVRCTAPAGQ